jgi:hypothetical protein
MVGAGALGAGAWGDDLGFDLGFDLNIEGFILGLPFSRFNFYSTFG